MSQVGLTDDELQAEIARRMARLDEAQEEEEHLGPYGELMRMVAMTAFQRAADLIVLNNRRIERQLAAASIVLDSELEPDMESNTDGTRSARCAMNCSRGN